MAIVDAINSIYGRDTLIFAIQGVTRSWKMRQFKLSGHFTTKTLAIPDIVAQPLLNRLAYLKYITHIRRGNLPTIRPSIRLETDEICHLEIPATYHKLNAKSVSYIQGRFVASSKKLRFLSVSGGTEINWNSIMRVQSQSGGVYLELSKKAGNGLYGVSDPLLVEVIIDTLVRMSKRQLIGLRPDANSRHIPQDVRIAVWQHDQGKCVECGVGGAGAYLEFDHIIPFSKGGASTIGNVQLLCRSCNLKKGDRL